MGSPEDFTITMSVAYTDLEKRFLERSVRSAARARPGELIIGADEGTDPEMERRARAVCAEEGFSGLRVLYVPRDPAWNMQLANVTWHCYKAAKHDKIYVFDVDSELRPVFMRAHGLIGRDGLAFISFTKNLVVRSPGDLVRFLWNWARIRTRSYVMSGTYWIYRPYFFENVPLEGYRAIRNGIDSYLADRIMSNGTHRMVCRKEAGVNCFDIQNGDYPWRQFQEGLWYGANPGGIEAHYVNRYEMMGERMHWLTRLYVRHPRLILLVRRLLYRHPYFVRGYRWAKDNPGHEAVRAAGSLSFVDWLHQGSRYVGGLGQWDREGTGFA